MTVGIGEEWEKFCQEAFPLWRTDSSPAGVTMLRVMKFCFYAGARITSDHLMVLAAGPDIEASVKSVLAWRAEMAAFFERYSKGES